ncbi:crAss001_48 related protein [uncultured Ligilactobacillus sp.]|uniref:crAss001_48 related protein n=1 Tax=uncultured Ligilactobacillus sp. TaxID=2837633 RepID=UPI00272C28F0|nr:sporulation protein Cse60 [uncultured Ligilactobacillus sp.]
MKVEIFDENSEFDGAYGFEKRINKFIQDKKVIDIKYQSNCSGFADSGVHSTDYERSALIMYEDNEETANNPVVEKLKEEKADLDEKIRKLKAFLNDDEKLSSIGKEQAKLLDLQLETMERYSGILWARIDDLEG